jgi:hypothetical protein
MKKGFLVAMLAMVVIAGCQESQMTAWIGGQQDVDVFEARAGIYVPHKSDPNGATEAGLSGAWKPTLPNDGDQDYRIGFYTLYWHNKMIDWELPIEIAGIKEVESQPYIGMDVFFVPGSGKDISYCFVGGTRQLNFLNTEVLYGKINRGNVIDLDDKEELAFRIFINHRFGKGWF